MFKIFRFAGKLPNLENLIVATEEALYTLVLHDQPQGTKRKSQLLSSTYSNLSVLSCEKPGLLRHHERKYKQKNHLPTTYNRITRIEQTLNGHPSPTEVFIKDRV